MRWAGAVLAAVALFAPRIDEWSRVRELSANDPGAAATAAVQALGATNDVLPLELQQLCFEIGAGLAERGELARAAELQTALHTNVHADWSAIDAALTLGRLGRGPEADALLAEHEARASSVGEIANHRGLLARGRGDDTTARRHFGRALVAGSRHAGLSLARMDLEVGDAAGARIGFRPGVDDAPAHDWALRGWALCLLP
jgi:hypothetical protein